MAQVKHALDKKRALYHASGGNNKQKRAKNRIESIKELPILLPGPGGREDEDEASQAEGDREDEGDNDVVDNEWHDNADAADDEDVVAAWLSALHNHAEHNDSDDDYSDKDEDIGREEDDNTSDNNEEDEDPPETQDPNMQPLPEENEKHYPQENDKYFLNKCYVQKDNFQLKLFMIFVNITSTNTEEDHNMFLSWTIWDLQIIVIQYVA
jgi:hypothetical protein